MKLKNLNLINFKKYFNNEEPLPKDYIFTAKKIFKLSTEFSLFSSANLIVV